MAENATKVTYEAPPDELLKVDILGKLFEVTKEMRKLRDENNLIQAETFVYKLPKVTAELLNEADMAEERIIFIQLLFSELFGHHTWCLEYRTKREGLVEALSHSEAIISILPFIAVGEEVIENILALHGMLLLLLGRNETAYSVVSQIPSEPPLSPTQLLALVLAQIARGSPEEAKKLIDGSKDSIDTVGIIDSIHKYANQCFMKKKEDLAINLLTFLVNSFSEEKELLEEPAERLFMVSRLSPHKIADKTLESIKKITGHELEDRSREDIPAEWRADSFEIDPDDPVTGLFSETYTILLMDTPPDREEVHVISWGSNTKSLWKIVIPLDMKPALEYAKSFKLTSGTVKKVVKRSPYDLKSIRGTIHVADPVLQIDIDIPWE